MPVIVITETGEEIPLAGDLVNGGAAADAFVASERAKLGLPVKPMNREDADAFLVAKRAREADVVLDGSEPVIVAPKKGGR